MFLFSCALRVIRELIRTAPGRYQCNNVWMWSRVGYYQHSCISLFPPIIILSLFLSTVHSFCIYSHSALLLSGNVRTEVVNGRIWASAVDGMAHVRMHIVICCTFNYTTSFNLNPIRLRTLYSCPVTLPPSLSLSISIDVDAICPISLLRLHARIKIPFQSLNMTLPHNSRRWFNRMHINKN